MKNYLVLLPPGWGWLVPQGDTWERWSRLLVSLSIIAFLPLQLPQILRNAAVIETHDPLQIAQLQVIPLLGYASGMMANLLLMSYLADRQEFWGTIVQALGVITSGIVVTQLFGVGLVDPGLFTTIALGVGVGLIFNFGRLWIPRSPLTETQSPVDLNSINAPGSPDHTEETPFDRYWSGWQNGLNVVGLTLFPLILTAQLQNSLFPDLPLEIGIGSASVLLGLSSTTLLGSSQWQPSSTHPLWLSVQGFTQILQRQWSSLSGWTANILFMFGPAAQLINNLAEPDSIAALSLPTQFLSVFGNLLILARSGTLWVQGHDRVWAVGGFWEVTVRGLVFLTIAAAGFMPFWGVGLYVFGVIVYFYWIYYNAQQIATPESP